MLVLYLDRYHLGDLLFLTGFAREVRMLGAPAVLVHGSGEAAERALEAEGRFLERRGGLLVAEAPEERAAVARAARELNRRIAHALNDAGVPAVRLEAHGRGLLRASGEGVEAGNAGWLGPLVRQGAVPVVASLVAGPKGVREVSGGAVAAALARLLAPEGAEAAVTFLVPRPEGLPAGPQRVALGALPEGALPEPEAVRAALRAGASARLTGRGGLASGPAEGLFVVEKAC